VPKNKKGFGFFIAQRNPFFTSPKLKKEINPGGEIFGFPSLWANPGNKDLTRTPFLHNQKNFKKRNAKKRMPPSSSREIGKAQPRKGGQQCPTLEWEKGDLG